MGQRSVQIFGCDNCQVEALHNQSSPPLQTKGWIILPQQRMNFLTEASVQVKDVGGYFCSLTCLNAYFRKVLDKVVNLVPVGSTDIGDV